MSKPTPDAESHNGFVKSTKEIIDKVVKDVRSISHNLSPTTLSYYGLTTAVEEHCNIINQSGKLRAHLVDDTVSAIQQLNVSAATALYRVLEELLNNTIKHSEATETTIKFSELKNVLVVEYLDNGIGMEADMADKKGMGLQNIESRLNNINAAYEVITSPGKGFGLNIRYQFLQNS